MSGCESRADKNIMNFIIVERGESRGVETTEGKGLDVALYLSENGPRGEAAARYLSATGPGRQYDNKKKFCRLQKIGESVHNIETEGDLQRFLRRLNQVCSGSAQGAFWFHKGRWQHR